MAEGLDRVRILENDMSYQIEFATSADEESLRSIFLASDMAVVGDVADHVVIKDSAGV